MQAVALAMLLVLAPHDGHVFGGDTIELRLERAVELHTPWVVNWRLAYGDTVMASGASPMDAAATVSLDLPEVRVRSAMSWGYDVSPRDEPRRQLQQGRATLTVHPRVDLAAALQPLAGQRIVVISREASSAVAELLARAGAEVQVIEPERFDPTRTPPALLIIDQDAFDERLARAVRRIASHPVGILVLAQSRIVSKSTLQMTHHVGMPARWRLSHPLLAGMDAPMLDAWIANGQAAVAWRIDPRDTAVGVGGWTGGEGIDATDETTSPDPPILDALVAIQTLDRATLVYWQTPVDSADDPRAWLLMRNTLLYLGSSPPPIEPTRLNLDSKSTKGPSR